MFTKEVHSWTCREETNIRKVGCETEKMMRGLSFGKREMVKEKDGQRSIRKF